MLKFRKISNLGPFSKICQMTILSIFLEVENAETSDLANCFQDEKTLWDVFAFVFEITFKSTTTVEKNIQESIWQGNNEET